MGLSLRACLLLSAAAAALPATASAQAPRLLFHVSADKSLVADRAGGDPVPNFQDKVRIVPDGAVGGAIQWDDDGVLTWQAPGNIYAQRGTLAFLWRGRDSLGRAEFPVFRVGYADHTSWDMVWLRIDWNGHGFDAFVTDANLARTRVSYSMPVPRPDEWVHLAFTWDETRGVRLYVNGRPAARKDTVDVYDAGLDQLGPHSRIISPYQVQSAYQFRRGGDIDEIRIYDSMLDDASIASIARLGESAVAAPTRTLADPAVRSEWWTRYGWNRAGDVPIHLDAASTRIRKVEFSDARDVKQHIMTGNDGIAETTWPGVYNRSRIPGRNDYFPLPDWNVYVDGGKAVTFRLPDEPWNHIELQGAASGTFTYVPRTGGERLLGRRPALQERTWHQFAELRGGRLRFDNDVVETPIQEVQAYQVSAGVAPAGVASRTYIVRSSVEPSAYPALDSLRAFIAGRYASDERQTVVALPGGAAAPARAAMSAALPIVHVLIPEDWQGVDGGLDGIALELPALSVRATHGAYVPLNIQIKDPLWPSRDMLDVSVSVKPGEQRTLWLTRAIGCCPAATACISASRAPRRSSTRASSTGHGCGSCSSRAPPRWWSTQRTGSRRRATTWRSTWRSIPLRGGSPGTSASRAISTTCCAPIRATSRGRCCGASCTPNRVGPRSCSRARRPACRCGRSGR